MAARETWTDERLDDLTKRVDEGFSQTREDIRVLRLETREEFRAVRGEMKTEFQTVRGEMKAEFQAVRGEMKEGFDRVDAGFDRINDQMLAQQRVMIQFGGAMFATTLVGFLGLLATILTKF